MKKIFQTISNIFRGFIYNPFWQSLQIIIVLVLSLAINGLLWYIYISKIKQEPIQFIYASGLIILNVVLANFLWNREKLISLFLIYTSLLIQILTLVLIRYLFISF